jgi:hypothetical protein
VMGPQLVDPIVGGTNPRGSYHTTAHLAGSALTTMMTSGPNSIGSTKSVKEATDSAAVATTKKAVD